MLSPELREKAQELIGRYPVGRSALLPLLHLVQSQDGHITDDGIAECAELLGLTKAEVSAVATFYTMYKRVPLGEHLISVCTNFSCKVRGAQDVYERLVEKLGVSHNETTPDGAFTLEHAECLGNCEGAPVVTIDYFNYECVTAEGAEALVDQVRAGDVPDPTRGLRSPGIRQIEHRLAGLGPRPDDVDRGAPLRQARADAGGVPPPAAAEVGPEQTVTAITPEFSEERERERAQARQAVREAGRDPDELEADAGAGAREFPTREPDWEPRRPGEAPERPRDLRGEDQTAEDAEEQTAEDRVDDVATDPKQGQPDEGDRTGDADG